MPAVSSRGVPDGAAGAPAAAQPRIHCPQGHAVPRLHGGGQVHAPVTWGKNWRKPRSAAPGPPAPRASPATARSPAAGAERPLHLPPSCCLSRSASREQSRPEPPPRLPLRPGADTAAGRGPGRGARKPDAARSFARRAHKVPALPALPTAGRPRRAAPALRPREEGGRGGGGVKRRPNWGGKEGGRGHRRGESRGRRRKEGGREGGADRPPRPRRLTGRNQRFALLSGAPTVAAAAPRGPPASFPPHTPGSAERAAEPQRRRATATGAGRHRAGRGGAGRRAAIRPPPASARPPVRRGHSLARARRPLLSRRRGRRSPPPLSPPAECGPRDGAPLSAQEGGSRRAEPSMGEVEAGPR